MIYNSWYGVLSSKDVKNNKLISVKRLGKNLCFYRDEKGIVKCVEDQCSHRGAKISMGKICGDFVACPFHGIEFDGTGQCKLVPGNGISSKDDLSRFNIKSYDIEEKHGIIYLWYGDKAEKTAEVPFFDELKEFNVYSEIRDTWDIHYSRVIENQLDVVHLPFVHYNTIGRGNKTLVNGPKVIIEDDNTITTSADNEVDTGQTPKDFDSCEIKETYLKFKFPNIWLNHISEKIMVSIIFAPIDDESTYLYLRFYSNVSKFKWINKLVAFFGKFGNLIIERQDKVIVEKQRPKISSLMSKENLIKGDKPIIMYRQIRDRLIKNSKK